MRGIRDRSYMELRKLQRSCIEQERIRVTDRFVARIEVATDLKMDPTLSKKRTTSELASWTGSST